MNLIKCPNGHFYDDNRFEKCPHCAKGSAQNENLTVHVSGRSADAVTTALSDGKTGASVPLSGSSLQDAVNNAIGGDSDKASGANNDQKTVSFYKKSIGSEPVTGWLVCVEGAHFGEDFRLKSGRNFIGRGSGMDVVISKDSGVSRDRHAVVVYEPKAKAFLVMPGESRELCYLNGEVVLTPKEIVINDRLTVGETELLFIPFCGATFTWDISIKGEK